MLQTLTGGGDSLLVSGAIFIASAVVVWRAGTRLAGYADRFARATGLGGAIVGLVLLGGVTSLPEIATSATAALGGSGGLAMNNLIGGVSLQLLVLAVIDILIGREALTSKPPRPDILAYAAMNILMLSVVAASAAAGDYELFGSGVGVGPVLVVVAYAGCLVAAKALDAGPRWKPVGLGEDMVTPDAADEEDDDDRSDESPARLGLLIAAAGAVILAAGFLLTRSGEAIAEQSGLGTSFFGAVFLSGATSLPELSSAIAAVKLGRPQLAIGDILGGNLFNLSLLLLVDGLYRPGPIMAEAGDFEVVAAVLGSILAAVFVIGLVERRDRTILRMGWDSAAAILIYLGGLFVLFGLRGTAAS